MKFSDIPGHDRVKRHLRQMVDDGRLPHALMLHGIPGIGKMALARALAQYIHCTSRTPGGDSCGVCPSCRQHSSFNHIDTFYSFPVSKDGSKTVTSDDYMSEWHDFLSRGMFMDFSLWHSLLGKKASQPLIPRDEARALMRKVSTTAHASDRKIVIIWLPERMNESAANAMLKLIEEPFADTDFILVSDNPQELLPTIRSRCQAVEIPRLADADIAGWLVGAHGLEPQDAASVAHMAEGCMTRALSLIAADDNGGNRQFLDMFISLMRLAYQRDVARLRIWANDLTALGREPSINFYAFAQRMIRENFMYNFNEPQLVYMSRDEESFSSRFARFITVRNAPRLVEAMNDAMTDIAGNANGKIVNFDLAIRGILLLK